jgi:hypothetical protein
MNKAPCLYCSDDDAVVRVSLDDAPEFSCASCDSCWSAAAARAKLDAWAKVLAWVETSPFRCEKPAAGTLKAV